jgi:hypothetical protein
MVEACRYLREELGNSDWLTEFRPVRLDNMKLCDRLLRDFQNHGICAAIVGNFPAYLAGVLRAYSRIEIAIAATNNISLFDILQRDVGYTVTFNFGFFEFYLETVNERYINYRVKHDESEFKIAIYPINCSKVTIYSKLNLVHYFWEECELIPLTRYSVVLLVIDIPVSTIFFLKHHRIESDGWTSRLVCSACILRTKRRMQGYVVGCDTTAACKCLMCLKQPATLKSIASHSVFRVLFNSESFVLSASTTYEEYKFMANSAKISHRRLFPMKSFPKLEYAYSYNLQSPTCRYHLECCLENIAQFWYTGTDVKFTSLDGAIKPIIEDKYLYWCNQCDRSLFMAHFPCRSMCH